MSKLKHYQITALTRDTRCVACCDFQDKSGAQTYKSTLPLRWRNPNEFSIEEEIIYYYGPK